MVCAWLKKRQRRIGIAIHKRIVVSFLLCLAAYVYSGGVESCVEVLQFMHVFMEKLL